MKTSWFKIGSAFSLMLASSLTACGSGDMYDSGSSEQDVYEEGREEANEEAEAAELGTLEQALHSCATPDGTNAVMAALAVAAGHELGRWRASLDFEYASPTVIRLSSGTGTDGKPKGKSRCSGGVCPRVEALLSLQNDNATGVYVQAETTNTRVLVNPSALRSRMSAKLWEQTTKDKAAKDGDVNQAPATGFKLTGAGMANLGGCGPHYKFNVAFDASTTTPKPVPAQLKWSLAFADVTNGWVDFRDLGNNMVAVDPTYGLNDEDTTSTGTCSVTCTKISTTNIAGSCCSCAGLTKTMKRSPFNANIYLCQ